MFNENHFKRLHRKTVTRLLPELRNQGFKYLALEAPSISSDSLLNAGSKVMNTMGFYTCEQNWVELLETAQDLGFARSFLFVIQAIYQNAVSFVTIGSKTRLPSQ